MEYCYHIQARAAQYSLFSFDKIQNNLCILVGDDFFSCLLLTPSQTYCLSLFLWHMFRLAPFFSSVSSPLQIESIYKVESQTFHLSSICKKEVPTRTDFCMDDSLNTTILTSLSLQSTVTYPPYLHTPDFLLTSLLPTPHTSFNK